MPDCSDSRKKKRFTLIASLEGLEKAEKSLLRLGCESQSNFARSQLISRSSVSNFFTRKPIQLDTFKRICEGLTLEWQDIAGMTEERNNKESKEKQTNLSSSAEVGVEPVRTLVRQITVLDNFSQKINAEIKLKGDIDSIQNIQLIASILRQYGGNTIKIIDIQEGSIKLIIEGSQEDIDQLLLRIELGELTEIDSFPIDSTQILSKDSEYEANSKRKWRLIEEIVNNPTIERNLDIVDLSDADLSGADLRDASLIVADLSGADLSRSDLSRAVLIRADLSGADLSHADLIGANLRRAILIGADLSGANLSRANLRDASLIVADLSGADLMDTNLIDTDLSSTNVEGARFSSVDYTRFSYVGYNGITEDLKQELIKRGGIFEDSHGDRSSIRSFSVGGLVHAGLIIAGDRNIQNNSPDQIIRVEKVIEEILNQLSQTYPPEAPEYQKQIVFQMELQRQLKENTTLRDRILSASKAGGVELVKVLTDNPFVTVPLETVKGWIEAEAH